MKFISCCCVAKTESAVVVLAKHGNNIILHFGMIKNYFIQFKCFWGSSPGLIECLC